MKRIARLPLWIALLALVPRAQAQDTGLALINAYATLSPHIEKAKTAFRKDRLDKCEEEALFCLKELPEHQEAHFLMSQVLYKRGEYGNALEHLRSAEEGYITISRLLLVLEGQKRQKQSEDIDRMTGEIADLAAAAAAVKGRGSCMPNRYDIALQDSKQVLTREEEERNRTDPDKDVAGIPALYRYWHGNVLFMLKRPAEAEAQYRQAIAKDPDFRETYNNLINLLFIGGRVDEARAVLAQAEAHKAKIHPELKKAVLARRP